MLCRPHGSARAGKRRVRGDEGLVRSAPHTGRRSISRGSAQRDGTYAAGGRHRPPAVGRQGCEPNHADAQSPTPRAEPVRAPSMRRSPAVRERRHAWRPAIGVRPPPRRPHRRIRATSPGVTPRSPAGDDVCLPAPLPQAGGVGGGPVSPPEPTPDHEEGPTPGPSRRREGRRTLVAHRKGSPDAFTSQAVATAAPSRSATLDRSDRSA